MTDTTQKLRELLVQCNADVETRKRVAASIKKLGLDKNPPAAIRKSLHITPANVHTLDVQLAKIADDVTQLQFVTSTTLSHGQLFTVFKYINHAGFEQITTDISEHNLTFFERRNEM